MFKKTSLMILMALFAATAFSGSVVAQEQDVCREAAGNDRNLYQACREAMRGGDADPCMAAFAAGGKEAYAACRQATGDCRHYDGDCFGPQRCPRAPVRSPLDEPQEPTPEPGPVRPSTGSCSETACRHVTLYNVDPERGDDCHEVVCRNVPAVIETVKIPVLQTIGGTDGLGGLLEGTPATQIVKERTVRVVKSAAFWCEKESGGSPGRSPTHCPTVVDTPAGDVGASPYVSTDFDDAYGTECSWVASSVGGHTYVDDDDDTLAQASSGSCDQHYTMYAEFGADRERYHLKWQC